MALLDLSNVTRVLVRLVQEVITTSPAWDGSVPVVSPLPPDKLGEAGDLLGFYLYHVGEDPHFKNAPPQGIGAVPVALAPMGLVLHYQLTAHTGATPDAPDGAYKAQLLFGLAMKALHDNPSIVDGTLVNGVPLLATFGLADRQNRFRLSLRPVPVEDAVTYWTAGQGPARLAAYYQVSVVMLEPDRPPSRASPVLERSVTVFVSGPPRLTGSRSLVTFTPPGSAARTLAASPAQVPIGGRFTLSGTDLVGEETELLLEQTVGDGSAVDPIGWSVLVTATEVSATVQATAGPADVVPGVWSAAVRVKRIAEAGAETREVLQVSNRTPILVVPEVSDPGAAAPGDLIVLTGTVFQHASIPTDPDDARSVQVIVGADALALDDDGALAPGEFEVTDAGTITLRLPDDLEPGFLPLRVRVNGAESPPRWVEVA